MSLSLNITKTIDEVVQVFISTVSGKYNLDINELQSMWNLDHEKMINSKQSSKVVESKPSVSEKKAIDPVALLKCNKEELVGLCKSYGYKCSGTKTVLIGRLLGKEDNDEKSSKSTKKNTDTKKVESKKVETKKVESTNVAKKLTANIPNILIRRNKYNNYEHTETGLIFDNTTKIVIGKQNINGSVDDLTEVDIDKCNAFKFKFKIPINLDGKSTLVDVDVDELNDEEKDSDEEGDEAVEPEDEGELLDEDELLGDEDYDEDVEEVDEEYDDE
jgi:hypothetical protein